MSAEAALAVRSWPVGRYTCTLTVPQPKPGGVMACVIEWSPDLPKRLQSGQIREYREGRDKALQEIARDLGVTAAVVEL